MGICKDYIQYNSSRGNCNDYIKVKTKYFFNNYFNRQGINFIDIVANKDIFSCLQIQVIININESKKVERFDLKDFTIVDDIIYIYYDKPDKRLIKPTYMNISSYSGIDYDYVINIGINLTPNQNYYYEYEPNERLPIINKNRVQQNRVIKPIITSMPPYPPKPLSINSSQIRSIGGDNKNKYIKTSKEYKDKAGKTYKVYSKGENMYIKKKSAKTGKFGYRKVKI